MKNLNLLSIIFLSTIIFGCNSDDDSTIAHDDESISKLLTSYALWYVEPDQASSNFGIGQDAISFSFQGDQLYTQNNLVGFDSENIGEVTATYSIEQQNGNAIVTIDGEEFNVLGIGANALKLVHTYNNSAFYISGYQSNTFPLEQAFYGRMPHFFNEYQVWKKTATENPNDTLSNFMAVNYLQFFPTRNFRTSSDAEGLENDQIAWEDEGSYALEPLEEVEGIGNRMILIYKAEEGEEATVNNNDTLVVRILNESSIEIKETKINSTYTFEGSTLTPF